MVAVEPKLSKGSNLLDFQKIFKKRLESHGLDTITYLPDPEQASSNVTGTNSGNMLSILTHHSRFTRERATALANEYFTKFDMYDRANNEDAKELLYNSIDTEIQKELDLVKDRFDTFVEHWMEVVSMPLEETTISRATTANGQTAQPANTSFCQRKRASFSLRFVLASPMKSSHRS